MDELRRWLAEATALSPETLLERIRGDLRRRWQLGQRIPAETYLTLHPRLLSDHLLAVAVIEIEHQVRLEQGEQPAPEEYAYRFPLHAGALHARLGDAAQKTICLEPAAAPLTHLATEILPVPSHDCPTPSLQRGVSGFQLLTIPGYRLEEELGRGGMGVVYKARQLSLDRAVALKMILAGRAASPRDIARFFVEAELLARVKHPNIVAVHDVGMHDGQPFMALEYVAGGSLARALAQGPLAPRQAAELVETLARAIDVAHRNGIIHRDLKPANILLSLESDPSALAPLNPTAHLATPKITDFGLARQLQTSSDLTQPGSALGTPSYMAPEQTHTAGPLLGLSVDVYSLGAILYACLTTQPPFAGDSALSVMQAVRQEEPLPPRQLVTGVPRDLETICLKCLQKEPEKRYASAEALADDLRRWLEGSPIQARPAGLSERILKWSRRRPAVAALSLCLFIVLIGSFAGLMWQWRQTAAALDQAEESLYLSQITEARLHWQAGNTAAAAQLLQRCVPRPGEADRRGWEWYYLDGLVNGSEFTVQHESGWGWGGSVVYRPDGAILATSCGNTDNAGGSPETARSIVLRDPNTGAVLRTIPCAVSLNRIAWSHDGRWLAGGAGDTRGTEAATLTVWNPDTGERRVEQTLPARIHDVAFSPDGRALALCDRTSTVRLYAWNGSLQPLWEQRQEHVIALAFSPCGRWLVSASLDRTVYLLNVQTGKLERQWKATNAVWSIALSPDGRWLATGQSDGIALIELASGKRVLHLTGHQAEVRAVCFAPDGSWIASTSGDGTVRVWEVASGVEKRLYRGHQRPVLHAAFHPEGRQLVSISPQDGKVKLWDVTRQLDYATLTAIDGTEIESIAFGAEGLLWSISRGTRLQGWQTSNGVQRYRHTPPKDQTWLTPASCTMLEPGGHRLACAAGPNATLVRVWDCVSGQQLLELAGHRRRIQATAFSPNGRFLATGAFNRNDNELRELRLWDLSDGKCLWQVDLDCSPIRLAFSPDNQSLVMGTWSGEVVLWSARDGKLLRRFAAHEGQVAGVCFSPDGRRLATGGFDQKVCTWDVRSGQRELELALPLIVLDVGFSPDGRRLVAATRELVLLWDSRTGQELLTLRGAPPPGRDPGYNARVLFSADGRYLAASNYNGHFSLWDAGRSEAWPGGRSPRREDTNQARLHWHRTMFLHELKNTDAHAWQFHLRRLQQLPLTEPHEFERRAHANTLVAEWDAALADYARIFQNSWPDSPVLWFEYLLLLQYRDQKAKVQPLAATLRQQFPPEREADVQGWVARCCALLDSGSDGDEIITRARKQVAERPKVGTALHGLGMAYYRRGRIDEAERCFVDAQRLDPEMFAPLCRLWLALCAQKRGNIEQAQRERRVAEAEFARMIQERPSEAAVKLGVEFHDWLTWHLSLREFAR